MTAPSTSSSTRATSPVWVFRACWLALPVLAGPALADALDARSRAVQVVASLLSWGVWGVALGASLVPRTLTLTLVRTAAPAAVAVTGWAAIGADQPAWAAAGVAVALASSLAALAPATADTFVDGSSYGTERRIALRTPAPLFLGPIPLAWVLVVGGVVSGPLLLAAGRWVAGGLALVGGAAAAGVAAVRLHQLSRRWLVFVPAGIVIHDPLALADAVLLPRSMVARFGPAPADAAATALDVTGGALGLAFELRATEAVAVGLRAGRGAIERVDVVAFLVTPGRPAATIDVAAGHRLPVT